MRRSGLEDRIETQLKDAKVPFGYESRRIAYVVPARKARYTPDFVLGTNPDKQILIEAKGYFRESDRKKLKHVRDSNPDLDIRLVFQRANNKLNKDSPTTYAAWCEKHGFRWADGGRIPDAWINEVNQG